RFSDADGRWRDVLDRNRIDVVVWRAPQAIVRLMEADPGWTAVYTDKRAVVLVRAGSSAAPAPPPAPAPPAAPNRTSAPAPYLGATVERFAAEQPVPFSVVARLLPAGPQTARLADRQVLSASLYKLFVARELLQRV